MRVVLDTNILVSALMIQTGNPAAIYRAWQRRQFTLLTCAEYLDELRTTLRKPAIAERIRPYKAGGLVNEITQLAKGVESLPHVRRSHRRFSFGLVRGGRGRLSGDRRQERFADAQTSQRHADHLRARIRRIVDPEDTITDLRYPIGKFIYEGPPTPEQRDELLHHIEQAPDRLRAAVKGLSQQQLDTPYRPEGWTVRQVAHHVPDSHLNAYIRTKLALTEDEPTIKPYAEDRWAQLADTQSTPVEVSLALLDSLHDRWVRLLRSLQAEDWKRTFRHPELGPMSLEKNLALYAWHGRHHVAHITALRERNCW